MYSYEITNSLQEHNYNIPSSLYIKIIHASPQINHIVYNPYNNSYEMWDEQGAHWEYSIYKD